MFKHQWSKKFALQCLKKNNIHYNNKVIFIKKLVGLSGMKDFGEKLKCNFEVQFYIEILYIWFPKGEQNGYLDLWKLQFSCTVLINHGM